MSVITRLSADSTPQDHGGVAVPELRLHKGTGQAYVLIGGRRRYFGRHSLPETHRRYHAFVAELLASGGADTPKPGETATVDQLCAAFTAHARRAYVRADGAPSGEARNYESALGLLVELYGPIRCDEFSPRSLRAVRQRMIERGWSRRSVNRQVVRLRTVFKWGVCEGLVDPATLQALQSLAGLREGQGGVRESEPVRALRDHQIEPVIRCAPPVVADMIRVQLLTGMRPGELCAMRPVDIDTSGPVWQYRPETHKNRHRDQGRVIAVGPRAQEALAACLAGRPVHAPLFSPIESERRRRGDDAWSPGPRSKLRDRYDPVTYRRAVDRACARAFPPPEETAKNAAARKEWERAHHWTPNQLRHTAATRIRSEAGLEMARLALGHTTSSVTEQYYAEADQAKVAELMRKIG